VSGALRGPAARTPPSQITRTMRSRSNIETSPGRRAAAPARAARWGTSSGAGMAQPFLGSEPPSIPGSLAVLPRRGRGRRDVAWTLALGDGGRLSEDGHGLLAVAMAVGSTGVPGELCTIRSERPGSACRRDARTDRGAGRSRAGTTTARPRATAAGTGSAPCATAPIGPTIANITSSGRIGTNGPRRQAPRAGEPWTQPGRPTGPTRSRAGRLTPSSCRCLLLTGPTLGRSASRAGSSSR